MKLKDDKDRKIESLEDQIAELKNRLEQLSQRGDTPVSADDQFKHEQKRVNSGESCMDPNVSKIDVCSQGEEVTMTESNCQQNMKLDDNSSSLTPGVEIEENFRVPETKSTQSHRIQTETQNSSNSQEKVQTNSQVKVQSSDPHVLANSFKKNDECLNNQLNVQNADDKLQFFKVLSLIRENGNHKNLNYSQLAKSIHECVGNPPNCSLIEWIKSKPKVFKLRNKYKNKNGQ